MGVMEKAIKKQVDDLNHSVQEFIKYSDYYKEQRQRFNTRFLGAQTAN